MGLIFSPEPEIMNGSILTINITKPPDVESFAYTTSGIPPVIAKYIAYDNLVPQNPFIATVEDGLGNILLDGGFPKWYNNACDISWSTYSDLSPSFKYLYDAIDFISNKQKVNSGNKKILILGDQDTENYCINDSTTAVGFKKSIDKICLIKGFTPTYKTTIDYGTQLNPTYTELDQYSCILFFSTFYTSDQLITNAGIQSLISYRENGNGIFFITDHGDRVLTSIDEAINTINSGFYRTANYVVSNFGCYFSGNYNRTPVNVGFLRSNYGNHILWNNLLDTDYIYAGGSESRINITEYTLYTSDHSFNITQDGYHTIKVLVKYTNGTLGIASYTYGKNVPEIIYFQDKNNINYTSSEKKTFLRTHDANMSIDYQVDTTGILKFDLTPIGSFTFSKSANKTTELFNTGFSKVLNISSEHMFYVQMTSPLSYTKGLKIKFDVPKFSLRTSRVLNYINDHEFKVSSYTSNFRNLNKLLCSKDNIMRQYENRFIYRRIYEYFLNINQPVALDPITAIATTTASYNFSTLFTAGETFWDITFYNGKYYLGTGSGAYASEDLQTWTKNPLTNVYVSRIESYKNYIAIAQTGGNIVLSTDNGTTFTKTAYGSGNIISFLFTTENTIDYLYAGTQDGNIIKIKLSDKLQVFKTVITNAYIDDMVEFNGKILFGGYQAIGSITYAGVATKITLSTITNNQYARFSDIITTPSGAYTLIEGGGMYHSMDGTNWTNLNMNNQLGLDYIMYNSMRSEFMIAVNNDMKFIKTPLVDFSTLTPANIISTFALGGGSNEIKKIYWEAEYNRYLIVSLKGLFVNYIP